uniref:Uncharacterized protein n=1 Tax=Romanomermis culicivorax TaxID=13658 RepID=A0A915KRI1_ROMCU
MFLKTIEKQNEHDICITKIHNGTGFLVIVFLAGIDGFIEVQFDRFIHFELGLHQDVLGQQSGPRRAGGFNKIVIEHFLNMAAED